MKKTILLLVAIFAMVACGKSDDNNGGSGSGSGSGNSSGWALKFLKSEAFECKEGFKPGFKFKIKF